jgi:hypothetical protein
VRLLSLAGRDCFIGVVADMFPGADAVSERVPQETGTGKVRGSPVPCARVCRRYSRWCSGPQVSDIAYHASPIPRLWPCSSSEGRTPRKETGSVFGADACCSTNLGPCPRCIRTCSRRWSFDLRKARKWALDSIFLLILVQTVPKDLGYQTFRSLYKRL